MATYDIRPLQLRILKNLLAIDKVCKEHNLRYYIMQVRCWELYATKDLSPGMMIWILVCHGRL